MALSERFDQRGPPACLQVRDDIRSETVRRQPPSRFELESAGELSAVGNAAPHACGWSVDFEGHLERVGRGTVLSHVVGDLHVRVGRVLRRRSRSHPYDGVLTADGEQAAQRAGLRIDRDPQARPSTTGTLLRTAVVYGRSIMNSNSCVNVSLPAVTSKSPTSDASVASGELIVAEASTV